MNKILKKISAVVQIVLLAPVKLPGKALNIIKYVALGLGILEAMTGEGSEIPNQVRNKGYQDDGEGESVPNSLRNGVLRYWMREVDGKLTMVKISRSKFGTRMKESHEANGKTDQAGG